MAWRSEFFGDILDHHRTIRVYIAFWLLEIRCEFIVVDKFTCHRFV